MRDSAGKRANRFHSLRPKELRLHPFLFRDVSIDDENRFGLSLIVTNQSPAALNNDFGAISSRLMHLTLPFSVLNYGLARSIELCRTFFKKDVFRVSADYFFSGPPIDLFSPLVPEQNVLVEIAHQNGVLSLVQ